MSEASRIGARVVNGSQPPVPALKVLVIDDDVMLARSIRRMLAWCRVEIETEPRHAVDRIVGGEDFDVIVCDVNMPTMSGYAVIDAIRASCGGQRAVPVLILVTGSDAIVEPSGADGILSKPFRIAELRGLVESLV